MICIMGVEEHPQVAAVRSRLDAMGEHVVVLDHTKLRPITVRIDGQGGLQDVIYDGQDILESGAIWAADKYLFSKFGDTHEWVNDYTRNSQWKETCFNLRSIMPVRVVNEPFAVARCESKLWQQMQAISCGFQVPDSIVTNDLLIVKQWNSSAEDLIVKCIGDPHLPRINDSVTQMAVMTSNVTQGDIDVTETTIDSHPLYFQRKIVKRYEYRVVVVRNKIFSFRVDPKQHKIMSTDYRRGGYMVKYHIEELPSDVQCKLERLHTMFGLFTGCYDFIEDDRGEFIFLEVNPNGIWALHDDLVSGAISQTFAERLVHIKSQEAVIKDKNI